MVQALVTRTANGKTSFMLIATRFFTPPQKPEGSALFQGLNGALRSVRVADQPFSDYAGRTPPQLPPTPVPVVSLLLPASKGPAILEDVLRRFTPDDLGEFDVMRIFFWSGSPFTRPLFRIPEEGSLVGWSALRRAPDADAADRMLKGNRVLYEMPASPRGRCTRSARSR